jgi:hypothetical protein
MPLIDVSALEQEGMPPMLISAYRQAVEAAWAEVAPHIRGPGSRPLMYLQFQDPRRDPETVTVSVDIGAKFGATSARNPADLQNALTQLLRDRFVASQDDDTGR